MSDPLDVRIGDAERDEAIGLLGDHLAAGRLDHDEFDQRTDQALHARTRRELEVLFTDLPEPRPATGTAPAAHAPASRADQQLPMERAGQPAVDWSRYRAPWWTHWTLFVAAIVLSGVSRLELGPLVPIAALWVWWLGPAVARRQFEASELQRHDRRQLP